jgi:hypothetical protein
MGAGVTDIESRAAEPPAAAGACPDCGNPLRYCDCPDAPAPVDGPPDPARRERWIEYMPLADLVPADRNPKGHRDEAIARSVSAFGYIEPVVLDERTGKLVAGHGRRSDLMSREATGEAPPDGIAVGDDGRWLVPVSRGWASRSDDQAHAAGVAINQTTILGGFDNKDLADLLSGFDDDLLSAAGFEHTDLDDLLDELGRDGSAAVDELAGDARNAGLGTLAERFGVPPFTVLDARQGYWQDRKRAWVAQGLDSQLGRSARTYAKTGQFDPVTVRLRSISDGISVFDPVLSELAYRWFCPPAGTVLDPFAGGSVRGIVAAMLGRSYTGVDLRPEQIDENSAQWAELKARSSRAMPDPRWVVGDSTMLDAHLKADDTGFDMVFSCPPFHQLERYSDDPGDLSNMDWVAFNEAHRRVIGDAVRRLADNRFAVWVVADIRDPKTGFQRNFVGETITAFIDAGCVLYNDAVLLTMASTAALRAGKQMVHSRKLCRTHQNVLVFWRGPGDPADHVDGVFGDIEAGELDPDPDPDPIIE